MKNLGAKSPFIVLLLIGLGVLSYQMYDSMGYTETVPNAKVVNIIQQCDNKSNCFHLINTDKGVLSVRPSFGNDEQYMNLIAKIKVDQTYNFKTEGKEYHLMYVPFFKKNYREVKEVI